MPITALPNPPSRSDPANFAERADAFMAALPVFAQEANALQDQVNEAAQAADENAASAGGSAQDAANSRTQAGQRAAEAASAADVAGQEATAAASAAALAGQWATKTEAPVAGGEFSAKHYAQLAAQGMGLPVFSPTNIPNADVGPIFVPTQGAMEWRDNRYAVLRGDHGQCHFIYVSPNECRLMPHNGDGLIIDGKQYRIDPAGVALPLAAVTGANGTANYVYAKPDGTGGFALEANTTGHARHTDGTEIKAGDPARLLVGMAYKNSAGQFQHDSLIRGVSSWFNRTYAPAVYTNFNTGTASLTPVQAMGPIYVWTWDGESIEACVNGRVGTTTAGAASITYSYINGIQNWSAAATSSTAGANVPVCLFTPAKALAEGLQAVSTYLAVTGGTSACALTQSIQARP